jgi:hypothetical protein
MRISHLPLKTSAGTKPVPIARAVTLVLILVSAAILPGPLFAAPRPDLWPYWEQHDGSSDERVDHVTWDIFLERYLDLDHASGVSLMRYGAVSSTDKLDLKRYIEGLEAVRVTALNRREQMAYWINLYNATTVKLILDNYPLESIQRIKDPWDRKLLTVEGYEISLNDIEHRILRPIFRDARVHYAVNCASIGCPNLQPVAYTASNLELLLDEGAREYTAHPRGVRIDRGVMTLSSIYKWFWEDFGENKREVLAHVARYAPAERKDEIRSFDGKIRYRYDWSLNE